jgi:hypothetical protein
MKANKFITVVAIVFFGTTAAFAQTWTQTTAPSATWTAIASSADGTKLFAVGAYWTYGFSTNSGATWTTDSEPQVDSENGDWDCIASSANGNTLVAMNAGSVWTSTNSGISWISNNVPSVNWWTAVALSADGNKAVAVDGGPPYGQRIPGGICTSTDSGMTWSETLAPSNSWSRVASSADGTILVAGVEVGNLPTVPVYVSTNCGATWAPTASPTNLQCTAVASSADGRMLMVGGRSFTDAAGMLYTSTNMGNTWISNSMSLFDQWYGVASSADGTKLVAVAQIYQGAGVFTSTNSGNTWNSNTVPGQPGWLAAASSADGTKLAAVSYNAGIWTLQTTPSPTLGITQANGNLALSWLIPSTNFVLQENADLTTTNWCNVTNAPALNLTNLQNQVTLPAPAGNAFFRLATP